MLAPPFTAAQERGPTTSLDGGHGVPRPTFPIRARRHTRVESRPTSQAN